MSPRQARRPRDPSLPGQAPLDESRSRLRLGWPGRTWEPGRSLTAEVPGLATWEEPGGLPRSDGRLVYGDALDVARALHGQGMAGQVDLVYIDPPFASEAAYVHEARLDGPADGRVIRAVAYDDRWSEREGLGGYLDMLAPRLEALAALLAPTGTIWVHVDYRANCLVRLILDEVMGRDAFVNEIVWRRAPNLGRQAASHQFGRTLDTIVVYGGVRAKLAPPTRLEPIEPAAIRRDTEGRPFTTAPRGDYTDESIARLEREGRVHRTSTGKVYVKYFLVANADGVLCRERRVDALWTDVAPLRHARVGERTGFPTQKPRALLDRIVACASPPGGLVVDLVAGSGTTGESAHALGRRFVLGDASALALATARARLMRAGVPLRLERCGPASVPPGAAARAIATRGGHQVRVDLEARDPLAWAIDDAFQEGRPFRTKWHSERVPGPRSLSVATAATLDAPPGPIAARVFYEDGSVATCFAEEA